MYYGQQFSGIPVPGRPQLPSTDTHLRRQLRRQFWDRKEIEKNPEGDYIFFRGLDENVRTTNMEVIGQIPVRRAVLLKKIYLKFTRGSKVEDIQDLFDSSVLRFHIEGDDSHRWVHFDKIDNHNYVIDLGQISLGAGQSFNVTLHVADEVSLTRPVNMTVMIDSLTDEPIC